MIRVLLDENVPHRLRHRLKPPHEVSTVQEEGWTSIQNGALLAAADGHFDVLITFDSNLEYQQDLTGKSISVLVIRTRSNTYKSLTPVLPSILEALEAMEAGQIVQVSG